MQPENLIPAPAFCLHHHIEVSFIQSLQEYDLIEVTSIEEAVYLNEEQLGEVERMIRLHYELNINLEGIDAIMHLMKRLEATQNEMAQLKNRLRLYEAGE